MSLPERKGTRADSSSDNDLHTIIAFLNFCKPTKKLELCTKLEKQPISFNEIYPRNR
ncbi:hypothetical protein SDC9_112235 [bioreactor metagenome]|uniref:Uncharacterized protein n=1 Tax=bioreactor metagenome TaxID=1076179 RepID=A0A645BIP6_9ZZZZ